MPIAWSYYGLSEIPGAKHNRTVVEMIAEVAPWMARKRGDETPWCSAFANLCMRAVEIDGTGSAAARSWLEWGRDVELQHGAVAVLKRPPNPGSGHVAFVVHYGADRLLLLGGNQGNRVQCRWYPRERLIGCRWPEDGA